MKRDGDRTEGWGGGVTSSAHLLCSLPFRLFAIDGATAEVVAEYDVTDARCCDWEDVAVGEFRGFPAIYVGDIGGNSDSGHCNTGACLMGSQGQRGRGTQPVQWGPRILS